MKKDLNIICMCPEHPQNLPYLKSSEVSESYGWESQAEGSVWRKPTGRLNSRLSFVHIPINITSSSNEPTTWDCMSFEVTNEPENVFSVNYFNKIMSIVELVGYCIYDGPFGKIQKILIYGSQLEPPATRFGKYWDTISFSKFDDYGYFGNKNDACKYAVNLLAIDKAKIDMEMLRVQLQLI